MREIIFRESMRDVRCDDGMGIIMLYRRWVGIMEVWLVV